MAIETTCTSCGKVLKARDEMAGRTAKCPDCGAPVKLPGGGPVLEAEDDVPVESSGGDGPRKPCPHCGEMIRTSAMKCRYCGEQVSGRVGARTNSGDKDEMTAVDWVLCVLCPGIACIVGIVRLCQGKAKSGGIMIGVSLGLAVVYNIINIVVQIALREM